MPASQMGLAAVDLGRVSEGVNPKGDDMDLVHQCRAAAPSQMAVPG